jgi:hypothetical protein
VDIGKLSNIMVRNARHPDKAAERCWFFEMARDVPGHAGETAGVIYRGAQRSSMEGAWLMNLVGAVGRLARVTAVGMFLVCALATSQASAAIIGVYPVTEATPGGILHGEADPASNQLPADIADDGDQVYSAYFGEDPSADPAEMTFAERLFAGEHSPQGRQRRDAARDAKARSQNRHVSSRRNTAANRQGTARPFSNAVSGLLPFKARDLEAVRTISFPPYPSMRTIVRLFFGGTDVSDAESSQPAARNAALLDTIILDYDALMFQVSPVFILDQRNPNAAGGSRGNEVREWLREDNILYRLVRIVLGIAGAITAVDRGTLGLLALAMLAVLAGVVVVRLSVRRAVSRSMRG